MFVTTAGEREFQDSQSHETVKHGHESCGTWNQEWMCWQGGSTNLWETDLGASTVEAIWFCLNHCTASQFLSLRQIFLFAAAELYDPCNCFCITPNTEGCMNVLSRQWKLFQINFPIVVCHLTLLFFLETMLKSTSHSVSNFHFFYKRDILCWLCIWLS
jgi:hypothetical protein